MKAHIKEMYEDIDVGAMFQVTAKHGTGKSQTDIMLHLNAFELTIWPMSRSAGNLSKLRHAWDSDHGRH